MGDDRGAVEAVELAGGQAVKAIVTVYPRREVLDPQGKAIEGALASLGFDAVTGVRQGKVFDIDLNETDSVRATRALTEMCEKLLANTVIENYRVELD
jgi:phosphoribosylformylglycinamidine synthase